MHFASRIRSLPKTAVKLVAALIAAVLLLYYPLGMFITHKVDDRADFEAQGAFAPEKGSHAVAVAAAVVEREISRHWAPNDPFFYPGWALVRMPAFQRGLISGVARFTIALSDQISRTRGSSTADVDLQKAVGLLNYPPTVWIWDRSVSLLPTASSEKQFHEGVKALMRYNARLAAGEAVFERRSDNLLEALDRFAADLGASSGAIAEFVDNRSVFAFGGSAALFYETKGKLYAYFLLMRELEKDFAPVLKEKQIETAWAQTLDSLREGMELSNFLVLNADPDNALIPSHLAAQGFMTMRARTQLREITDILLK